jgi:methionyl aminopeptidase
MAARAALRVSRKTPGEIKTMREAGRILARVLAEVAAAAQPGVTTEELDKLARARLAEAGAEPSFLGYRGYPAALCVEIEDVVVHGIPDGTRLEAGTILGMDLGAVYQGFQADTAVTIPLGEVDEPRGRLLAVTQQALAAAIAQARPGNRLRELSAAVQGVAEGAGFSVVRDLVGHGIGRQMHEPPQVPNFVAEGQFVEYDLMLRPGMTLAIEPMINAGGPAVRVDADGWTVRTADGRPSAHFEHTVAVGRKGPQILTLP